MHANCLSIPFYLDQICLNSPITNGRSFVPTVKRNINQKKKQYLQIVSCHLVPYSFFWPEESDSISENPNKKVRQVSNTSKMPAENTVVSKVIVHPLVLLSVVDHFNRMGKIGNQKRVVGVLLGCWRQKGVLDVSNSFAGKCPNTNHYSIKRTPATFPMHCYQHISDKIAFINFFQFHSMRMTKTNPSGSWTMTIWIACMECSKR